MNILLTSSGRRSYLVHFFREALNGNGLVHASNSEWSSALEIADKSVITPLIYSETYIDFIYEYCIENEIEIVVSLFDVDLPVLALSKKRFYKAGINVIVSDYEVTQVCNDKWNSYSFFKQNKINTPKTYIEIDSVLVDLSETKIKYPLIIKPRWGMGSKLVYRADDEKELLILYAKAKREIINSYLKYESQSDPNRTILIQEFIEGQEYGMDITNNLDKQYIATFVTKKLEMRTGETYHGITQKYDLLEQIGNRIANSLGHVSNLDTDCIVNNDLPYIIDMNCRFGGVYPFTHIAGVNLPKAIIKWVDNASTNEDFSHYRIGVEAYKYLNISTEINKKNSIKK